MGAHNSYFNLCSKFVNNFITYKIDNGQAFDRFYMKFTAISRNKKTYRKLVNLLKILNMNEQQQQQK